MVRFHARGQIAVCIFRCYCNPMNEASPAQNGRENGEELLHISVFRHGPKLSASGEKNQLATDFRESVEDGYMSADIPEHPLNYHIATSRTQRAKDTASIIAENSLGQSKEFIAQKDTLGAPHASGMEARDERYARDFDRLVALQKTLEPEVRRVVEGDLLDSDANEQEREVRNRLDGEVLRTLFDDADEKDVEKRRFEVSYEEIADTFAKRYLGFAKHADLLQALKEKRQEGIDGKYFSLDVSHSFPIMAFLKKYLIFPDGAYAREMNSEEFLSRIGGVIPESGHFDMR